MSGTEILLQSVFRALKVNIAPGEVETAWNQAKESLPKLAASFEQLRAAQERCEVKLDLIISRYGEAAPVSFEMETAPEIPAESVV